LKQRFSSALSDAIYGMSISKKNKWRRALSRLRFNYEEIGLIKEIARDTAQDFQLYYENFCRNREINISKLNDRHRDRVKDLYNIEKTIPDTQNNWESEVDTLSDTAIALHKNISDESDQKDKHQMTADETAVHEAFSKLFKQIALKIHPDKLGDIPPEEKEVKVSMFQRANKSFEDRKYFILLDIASQLKIQTPKNYDQQTRWMKREIASMEEQIKREKSTYNFLFSEAETDEERDQLVRGFMLQVFQIHVE
jgi:hypothetical protein